MPDRKRLRDPENPVALRRGFLVPIGRLIAKLWEEKFCPVYQIRTDGSFNTLCAGFVIVSIDCDRVSHGFFNDALIWEKWF